MGPSKKEKLAMAQQAEAARATTRAANAAAEQKQQQASEMGVVRRVSKIGRRQLSWLPLGGVRQPLGTN